MKRVDLNVDIGEGFPYDRELLSFATSANVCLGFHAGSRELTEETYWLCRDLGIRTGAHPGYADRATMGRGPRPQSDEANALMAEQMMFVLLEARFDYVKPHGSLYNESAKRLPHGWSDHEERISRGSSYDPIPGRLEKVNPAAADVFALVGPAMPLMGLAGTTHSVIASLSHSTLIREGFADRAYQPDGMLVPRSEPGAVLDDPDQIRRQALSLAERVDSICLHGDTPDCLEFAELVYKALKDEGFEVGA